MKNTYENGKKLSLFLAVAVLVLVGSFVRYQVVQAAAGDGTATINVDGGAQGAGVTVVQGTSHIFKAVLTIASGGMTLGAISPTFTIPTGFTAPNEHAVATAGDVNVDGEWSVTMGGPGGCTVDSAPGSALTVASGQIITVDITADCAVSNTITLTYQGTSAATMGATQLVIKTSDGGQPIVALTLAPGSPTITVTAAAPTCTLTADPTSITSGNSSSLSWTTTDATSFAIDNSVGTVTPTASGSTSVSPVTTTTYTGTVTGAGGSATCGATVTVTAPPAAPTCTLTATPTSIASGNSSSLSWTTTNATSFSINNSIGTVTPTASGSTSVSPVTTTTYTGTVTGAGGSATCGATVTILPAPTCTLTANPTSITPGASSVLSWTTTNATSFTVDHSVGTVTPTASGSTSVSPTATTIYGGTATGTGGSVQCAATVTSAPIGRTGSGVALLPPLINVTKIPSPLALPAGSGSVTYTFTVTNLGTIPMTGVTVTDNTCSPLTFVSGDTNNNAQLGITETWTYRCTATVSQTTTNRVTATGHANGFTVIDTADATVVVGASIVPPLIHLVKVPSVFVLPAGGGAVTYAYTVTNPGTVPLSDVIITDDKCTGLPGRVTGHPGDLNHDNLLDPNETWHFTCQTNLTQTTTNTGTAAGHANGLTAYDFAPATVVVAPPNVVIPKLPGTGFPLQGASDTGNAALIAGIFIALFASFIILKKRDV